MLFHGFVQFLMSKTVEKLVTYGPIPTSVYRYINLIINDKVPYLRLILREMQKLMT